MDMAIIEFVWPCFVSHDLITVLEALFQKCDCYTMLVSCGKSLPPNFHNSLNPLDFPNLPNPHY